MATVLITQCLQRDFVDPIGPHDPLPNLLHVGHREATRLLGPEPSAGPLAQLIDWAHGLAPDAIDLIHIRDWHDPGDPAQREHLQRFGAHCIKGSNGARLVLGMDERAGAASNEVIVDSLALNDLEGTDLVQQLERIRQAHGGAPLRPAARRYCRGLDRGQSELLALRPEDPAGNRRAGDLQRPDRERLPGPALQCAVPAREDPRGALLRVPGRVRRLAPAGDRARPPPAARWLGASSSGVRHSRRPPARGPGNRRLSVPGQHGGGPGAPAGRLLRGPGVAGDESGCAGPPPGTGRGQAGPRTAPSPRSGSPSSRSKPYSATTRPVSVVLSTWATGPA